jgi:hypothetical protein
MNTSLGINRGMRLSVVFSIVVTLLVGAPPVLADSTGDIFGKILGTVVVLSAREAERKREQAALNKQQQAKKRAEQQQSRELAIRAQTALKALGFYTKGIDGDFGSGSKRALTAYQNAFQLEHRALDEYELSTLEQFADEGWRSAQEYQLAIDGGFSERDELVAAQQGGFQTRSDWLSAQNAGFADRQTYRDYLAGDFGSKQEFDQAMLQKTQTEEAKSICLGEAGDVNVLELDTACQIALASYPSNPAVRAYAKSASASVKTARDELNLSIAQTQQDLVDLLSNSGNLSSNERDTKTAEARQSLESLNNRQMAFALQVEQAECAALVNNQNWDIAKPVCDAAMSRAKSYALATGDSEPILDIQTLSEIANEQALVAKERAAKEQARLALTAAENKGKALVADVQLFSARGGEFEHGLRVARAMVSMTAALEAKNAAAIENAHRGIEDLVGAETSFIEFRQNKASAEQQTAASGALAARAATEGMNAFLKDYISHNLTSPSVGELLDLQDKVAAALEKGNVVEIANELSTGRSTISRLGLAKDLDAYVLALDADVVSDETLAQNKAAETALSTELQTAQSDAQSLIEELEQYSQTGASFDNPLAVGRALVQMRGALSGDNVSVLLERLNNMETILATNPKFMAARELRTQVVAEARQNTQVLASETGASYNAFLIEYIASNITSADIEILLSLQGQLDESLKLGDWQQILNSNSAVHGYLASANLQENYKQFVAVASAKKAPPTNIAVAKNGIAVNAANEELLVGDDEDMLALKNNAGTAPNLSVNLLGNLSFDEDTAVICWVGETPSTSTATLLLQKELRELGINGFRQFGECQADYLRTTDIILVHRGQYLKQSASDARQTILDFERGSLVQLVTMTARKVAAYEAQLQNSAQDLTEQIIAEEKKGYGLVYLPNGSGDVCFASDTDAIASANVLHAQRDVLEFYYANGTPELAPVHLERAFIRAQRNTCSGIYADAEQLKQLLLGLERENVSNLLVPIWISEDEYGAQLALIDETKQQGQQRLEAQRQQASAEAELERQQNETEEKIRFAAQEKLRNENRTAAMGAMKRIADMASGYPDGDESRVFDDLFPGHARLRQQQSYDKWRITSHDAEIWDYGTGIWQGRRVAAVLVEVRYQSENAVLGKYREDCAVVGYLIDDEFDSVRDAVEGFCAQTGNIEAWKTSHAFDSGWFVK